jgi:hypothetical protein
MAKSEIKIVKKEVYVASDGTEHQSRTDAEIHQFNFDLGKNLESSQWTLEDVVSFLKEKSHAKAGKLLYETIVMAGYNIVEKK